MNKSEFLSFFQHARIVEQDGDYPLQKPSRPAAVLIPIIEHQQQLTVLFTVRAKHLKHHGGQISFPGGKQEPWDNAPIDAALRETEEEIGIAPNNIDIVGSLPQYRTISGYNVSPFIGFVPAGLSLTLDNNEVDCVFEVPLSYLINQQNHFTHWVTRNNHHHPVYFISWQKYTIWGATAVFVRTLSHHLSHTN